MQAFTPNDDIAHQKRSMVAIPVVSATASEGFSSKKSIPSPKVNSWNEPIRPSNSSNTDPTLSPKIMNKYLRVSRLSKASYPDQLSENMKMSSNHLVRGMYSSRNICMYLVITYCNFYPTESLIVTLFMKSSVS